MGSIIFWLIFGGLVGWIASKIMGTDAQQGILLNIIVGIVGAFIGGFLANILGLRDNVNGFFDPWGWLLGIVGVYSAVPGWHGHGWPSPRTLSVAQRLHEVRYKADGTIPSAPITEIEGEDAL